MVYTENSGEDWEYLQSSTTNHLLDIVISGNKGYAVGLRGTIIKSSGNEWITIPFPSPFKAWLSAISVVDESRCIFVGRGSILRTEDGGDSWSF